MGADRAACAAGAITSGKIGRDEDAGADPEANAEADTGVDADVDAFSTTVRSQRMQ